MSTVSDRLQAVVSSVRKTLVAVDEAVNEVIVWTFDALNDIESAVNKTRDGETLGDFWRRAQEAARRAEREASRVYDGYDFNWNDRAR